MGRMGSQMIFGFRTPNDDERGATAVEYGLMVAFIAIAIIGGVTLFGLGVSDLFKIPPGVMGP